MLAMAPCLFALAFASGPARVEVAVTMSDDFTVIPLGDQGVGVVKHSPEKDGWSIRWYDRDLRLKWSTRLDLAPQAVFQAGYAADDAWWLAFFEPATHNQVLVRAEPRTGPSVAFASPNAALKFATDLVVTGQEVWEIGRSEGHPVALHLDLHTAVIHPISLAANSQKSTTLDSLRVADSGQVELVYSTTNDDARTLHVADLHADQVVSELSLSGEAEARNLLTVQRTRLADGGEVLVGTYADGPDGFEASGVYVAFAAEGQVSRPTYHPFVSFAHFFDHLSPPEKSRTAARIERAAIRGTQLTTRYELGLHDAIERPGEVLVTGDAFYPVFTSEFTAAPTSAAGRIAGGDAWRNTFRGWSYTHGLVVCFGRDGSLRWDAAVPLTRDLTVVLQDHLKARSSATGVEILWPGVDGGTIARVGDHQLEVPGGAPIAPPTSAGSERLRATLYANAAAWYDDAFLLWGFELPPGEEEHTLVLRRVQARHG